MESSRRSRRLRGAEVEFSANALEEIEKERRSSRSRSRSVTPSIDRTSKSAGLAKSSATCTSNSPPASSPPDKLKISCNDESFQRARIDFDDSEEDELQTVKEEKQQKKMQEKGEEEDDEEEEEDDEEEEGEELEEEDEKEEEEREVEAVQEEDEEEEEEGEEEEGEKEEEEGEELDEKEEEAVQEEYDEEGGEERKQDEEGEESGYEEDIEDPKAVQKRRGKLPKSALDDKFFNLAEMNAFLGSEDKKEEEKERRNGRNLGQIENADEMEQLMSLHEQTNLQPRDWALSGEAKAEERPKDALLDKFVDADYQMLAPPTIDAEMNEQLESMITKRIKDGLFDDVVRKVRVNESLQPEGSFRNATTVVGTTEKKVRKSLAEVYGDKFSAGINDEFGGEGNKERKLDPTVEGIKSDLDTLFLKLDALSHFQFRPQPIQKEVKIVSNMPSLHMEEVGPEAAVGPEVNLLAPEEVKRRVKSAPKAADERTETDRKRERRGKKKKQRILASVGAMNGEGGDGEATERRVKKKKVRRVKMDFAEQIQKLVQNGEGEAQQQLKKKRKRKVLGENGEEKQERKTKKKSKVGKEKE